MYRDCMDDMPPMPVPCVLATRAGWTACMSSAGVNPLDDSFREWAFMGEISLKDIEEGIKGSKPEVQGWQKKNLERLKQQGNEVAVYQFAYVNKHTVRDGVPITSMKVSHQKLHKGFLERSLSFNPFKADTFYLDGSARQLKAVFDGLRAKSDFRFLPEKTHFDLYRQGDDRHALLKQISWEMHAVARPKSALKAVK